MIWHNIKNKKPIAYLTGDWDGKKSDRILVCTQSGGLHIAEMYEGVIDGNEFCEFYNNFFEIDDVVFWTEINSPI